MHTECVVLGPYSAALPDFPLTWSGTTGSNILNRTAVDWGEGTVYRAHYPAPLPNASVREGVQRHEGKSDYLMASGIWCLPRGLPEEEGAAACCLEERHPDQYM